VLSVLPFVKVSIVTLIIAPILACGSGDYDPTGNPDNDALWSERDAGIDDRFHQIPAGTSHPDEESLVAPSALCSAVDLDGDGQAGGSYKTVLEFESEPKVGRFSRYVYVNSTQCDKATPDYIDQLQFDYTLYSARFYFNRIDGEVAAFGRIVMTNDAVTLLNNEAACGMNNWSVSASLASVDACVSETSASVNGFLLDESVERKVVGEKVEGLYVYVGEYFTYKIGKEGERPPSSEIAEFTGSELTGDPLFVRF